MDLDAAAIADEDHHRDAATGEGAEHCLHRAGIERAHERRPGDAVGAEPVHPQFRCQAQELVGVGHAPPFGAQRIGLVWACLWCLGRLARREVEGPALIGQRLRGARPHPRAMIRAVAQDDLVHRVARRVEHLKAAARAAVGLCLDHEGMAPMRRKDAQVDVVGQDHRRVVAGVVIGVCADLFVHAGFVARERHHLAQVLRHGHHRVGMGGDAGGAVAAGRGNQRRLGDAERVGLVTRAHRGVPGPEGTDLVGGYGGCLGHAVLSVLVGRMAASRRCGGRGCGAERGCAANVESFTLRFHPDARDWTRLT